MMRSTLKPVPVIITNLTFLKEYDPSWFPAFF